MREMTNQAVIVKTAYLRMKINNDREAAERIGISPQTFKNWINKSVTARQLSEMARILNLTDEELVSFVRGYQRAKQIKRRAKA